MTETPKSAEALRMAMLESQLAEVEKRRKAQEAAQGERAAFVDSFLKDDLSEREREMIRRLVLNAASDGKLEAMVYSFPSELCSDGGRAINNGDPDWPDTLQGKARQLYERYKEVGQPLGYKLKATIVNFPGGMPGDVGFFLNWEPDRV